MSIKREDEFEFGIHDAAWFGDRIVRIEHRAIDEQGRKCYLIQTSNHLTFYVLENELERYIG